MTNAAAVSYAAVLLDLDVAPEMVAEAEQTFRTYPQLTDVLSNPTISEAENLLSSIVCFPSRCSAICMWSAEMSGWTAFWKFFRNITAWSGSADIAPTPFWNM